MPRKRPAGDATPPPEETKPDEQPTAEDVADADSAANGDPETPDTAEEPSGTDEFHEETTSNPSEPAADEPAAEEKTETAAEKKARRKREREAEQAAEAANEEEAGAPTDTQPAGPQASVEFTGLDDEEDYLKGFWYGPSGSGKTSSMLTVSKLDEPGRIIVINAEAGLKVRALRQRGVDTSRVQLWPNVQKGERVTYDGLEALFYTVQRELEEDPNSILATVWDSQTEIVQLLLDDLRDAGFKAQQEKLAKSTSGRTDTSRKRFKTETDDYTEASAQVRYLIRKFKFLPCHFLMSALERKDENSAGRDMYGPSVNPALQQSLMGYVDVVVRTAVYVDENNRSIWTGRTNPSQHEMAKDRYGALPINMVDPTVDRIYGYITGELTEDTDPARSAPGVESALQKVEERAESGKQNPTGRGKKAPAKKKAEDTSPADETADPAA